MPYPFLAWELFHHFYSQKFFHFLLLFLLFFTYCHLQWYSCLPDPFNQYINYLHSSSGGLKMFLRQIDFYPTSPKAVRKCLRLWLSFSLFNNLTDLNQSRNFTYFSIQVLVTVHHNLKVLGFFTWFNCCRVQWKSDLSH